MTPICRAKRLFNLAFLLREPHNVVQLAAELGVCQRTIQRDLVLLQTDPLSIPLYEPKDCFYQILPGWTLERLV